MHPPYSELKKGTFLIASPNINNGIFFRCVVLLCEHTPLGSFGLIVNKPLEVNTEHSLLELTSLANSSIQMRVGGPNQPNQIIMLQNFGTNADSSLEVCEGVYLNLELETLQNEPEEMRDTRSSILYFGYGGWNEGALEREFLNGNWFLYPASNHHVFETSPKLLWQTLLREMGGKYITLSMIPEDLDLN